MRGILLPVSVVAKPCDSLIRDITYALDMWSVEKRPNGWYFSKSAYHGDKHHWRGP